MNKLIQTIIVVALLIVALSVAYYFVYHLPHLDKEKNRVAYYKCLSDTDDHYEEQLAEQCKENYAKQQQCMEKKLSADVCFSLHDFASDKPNCRLPDAQRNLLNERYTKAQDDCNNLYPQDKPRASYSFYSGEGMLITEKEQRK